MASLAVKFPRTTFHLLQPPQNTELLFGPSMGFAASQAALRFGYSSTRAWLDEQGAALLRQLTPADLHEGRRHGPPPPDARSVPAKP
jgi:hypothetical protein